MKKLSVNTDDELPDYIMVMVANRKTEEQMAEDLSLFLSNNTNKFTSWFVVQVLFWLFTLMMSPLCHSATAGKVMFLVTCGCLCHLSPFVTSLA